MRTLGALLRTLLAAAAEATRPAGALPAASPAPAGGDRAGGKPCKACMRLGRRTFAVLLSLSLVTGPTGLSLAEVPRRLSYRGSLADNLGRPVTGAHSFRVKLYSASSGGSLLYTEDFAGGDAASVFNGIYELEIGSVTGTVPASVFDGDQVWLELDVKAGTSLAGAETLLPRQRMTAEAYAFHARTAEYLGTGAFITTHTATGDLQVPGTVTAAAFVGNGAGLSNVPPTGAAGGDLSGNYPNPAVVDDSHQHSNASLTGIAASKVAAGSFASGLYDFPGSLGIGTASPSGLFQVGGGTLTATALGRVGVGTTVPTQALQVIGTVAATDFTCTDCLAAGDLGANSVGASELAATAVTAGTYGDATTVGRFTVDADGRLTGVSSTTISGVSPGGAAGGDLSGSYPSPDVLDDSHSHGDATVSDNISINNAALFASAAGGDAVAVALRATGAVATGAGLTLSDEGAFKRVQSYEGEPLSINPLGNNVGVGTSSPADLLEVAGNLRAPILYDRDNTGYYLDPHQSSRLERISSIYLDMAGDHLEFGANRTNDTTYEWTGWYSGATRQAIALWDGAWAGCGNRTDEFCLKAEGGNDLSLYAEDDIVLVPVGNVGIGTTNPAEGVLETFGSTGTLALTEDASARSMVRMNNNTAARAGSLYVLGSNVPASDSIILLSNQSAGSGLALATRDGAGTAAVRLTVTGAGSVGIGSTAPGQTLTVNGSAGGTAFSAWDQNASNDIVSGTAAGGDLAGTYPNPTVGANAVALTTDTSGNYVGTVTAGTGISVSGSGAENAAVTVSVAADSLNFTELADGMAVDAPSQIDLGANKLTFNVNGAGNLVVAASGVDTHAFNSSGQVGIGTTVPGFTLQVNGTAGGTAFSAWDQNASNDIVSGSAAGGDLAGTYPSPSVVDDSHSHSDATLTSISASEVQAGNFPSGTFAFPGALGAGGTGPGYNLEVFRSLASNVNPTASLTNSGAGSASSLRFAVSGPSSYALGMTSAGDFALGAINANIDQAADYLRVKSGGAVVVGGTAAVASGKLTVKGPTVVQSTSGMWVDGSGVHGGYPTSTALTVDGGGSDILNLRDFSAAEVLTVLSNGNVGLGTASPIAKLDVAGSIYPSDTGTGTYDLGSSANIWRDLYVDDIIDSRNASDFSLYFYSNGGYDFTLDYDNDAAGSTTDLQVHAPGDSDAFTVERNGRVGVGTAAPPNKLHVVGSIGATDWIGAGCEGSCEGSGGYSILYANGTIGLYGGAIYGNGSGNIGIGNSSPGFPLTVGGRIATGGAGSGGVWMDGGSQQFMGSYDSARVGIYNNGSWSLIVENTGLVGIGTWDPLYMHHTQGQNWHNYTGSGVGTWLYATGGGGTNYGAYGYAINGTTNYGIYNGAGTKSWANPHPHDPTKSVVYATLEGGENATYWRGRAELVGGRATVRFPEHFALASSPDYDVTVTATPRSAASRGLAVVSSSVEGFEAVELEGGRGSYEFDYIVMGKRRAYETWNAVQDVLDYVPNYGNQPGRNEPTQGFYDKHPEGLKKLFISNGLLNPDGTVNRETFARHGWKIYEEKPEAPPPGPAMAGAGAPAGGLAAAPQGAGGGR